ncbi:HAD family phosphatase [Aerococcus agrisoli]|uniref:HAD family phosphatase n=1 Tax=Aerococcus agrisoli TaxID=2487350 RepID=A0A3N4GM17_9LACT|nr:HAD family phosphatase [Aerococcus agrisoli]RPA62427.1 HAD family phosphatase [Aerococcus agrisoli]
MKEKRLAIFDMDGILVSSEHVYASGWQYALKSLGLDHLVPSEELFYMRGASSASNLATINRYVNDWSLTQQVKAVRDQYFIDELNVGHVPLLPYAKELLAYLQAKPDIQLILASNTPSNRGQLILAKHDLAKYFDQIIMGDHVENLKPAPDIYLKALKLAQVPAEQAIIFEDSLTGATAGKNAHIDILLVPEEPIPDEDIAKNDKIIAVLDTLEDALAYFD